MKYLDLITPAVITLIGNIIFYLFVKKGFDKALDKQKVAFSGVFNEKIIVYKETLNQYHNLIHKIESYNHTGHEYLIKQINQMTNDFIHYSLVNEPLFSVKMVDILANLTIEINKVFDSCQMYYTHSSGREDEHLIVKDLEMKKFKKDGAITLLFNEMIKVMRNDMHL